MGFGWAFLRSVEPVIGIVAAVAAWIMQAGMALNFRSRNLPPEARKPWYALAVLFVITIPFLVGELGPKYQRSLPGVLHSADLHQITVRPLSSLDPAEVLEFHVESGWQNIELGSNPSFAGLFGVQSVGRRRG